MGTLLDTSILIDIERGRGSIPTTDDIAIAAITASELLQGVLRADRAHRTVRESFVEGILAMLPTIPFSLHVARVHARIWADLAAARVTVMQPISRSQRRRSRSDGSSPHSTEGTSLGSRVFGSLAFPRGLDPRDIAVGKSDSNV